MHASLLWLKLQGWLSYLVVQVESCLELAFKRSYLVISKAGWNILQTLKLGSHKRWNVWRKMELKQSAATGSLADPCSGFCVSSCPDPRNAGVAAACCREDHKLSESDSIENHASILKSTCSVDLGAVKCRQYQICPEGYSCKVVVLVYMLM